MNFSEKASRIFRKSTQTNENSSPKMNFTIRTKYFTPRQTSQYPLTCFIHKSYISAP